MTSGSDSLRKMSLLRRKVRRRDVTRYMFPHLSKFTRQRKQSINEQQNKSAITDHVVKENHVIGWDEASILGREGNRSARWIRESIEIRKQDIQGHTMNRDAGTYTLSHLYDALFSATATSCGENRNRKSFRERQQMLPKRQ